MLSFLKVFARGVICTVLLPLILLVWVLYGVFCLFAFFVVLIKSIILFFAGDDPTGEMKEDIEARRILLEDEQAKLQQSQVMNMMYQNMAAQQMYGQPMMQPGMIQQPVYPQQAGYPQQQYPQQGYPQQAAYPQAQTQMQPQAQPQVQVQPQPQRDFNPFTSDPIPENPIPGQQPVLNTEQPQTNNEGDSKNDQSY